MQVLCHVEAALCGRLEETLRALQKDLLCQCRCRNCVQCRVGFVWKEEGVPTAAQPVQAHAKSFIHGVDQTETASILDALRAAMRVHQMRLPEKPHGCKSLTASVDCKGDLPDLACSWQSLSCSEVGMAQALSRC